MSKSRYTLYHAIVATIVLMAMLFRKPPAKLWRQFIHGFAVPPKPEALLHMFLMTALVFGALLLILWLSTLFVQTKSANKAEPECGKPKILSALGIAAIWSPSIIAITVSLNWLCAAGIEHIIGTEPSDQELVKCYAGASCSIGMQIAFGSLALFQAPFLEEPLFRGVIFRGFASKLPIWVAVALSGFLFAIIHVNAASFVSLFFLSCALAELYRRTGTILAPIMVHLLFNATNLVLIPFLVK